FKSTEDAAQGQPVGGYTDPVVVVCGAQDAGNEDQPHDHVQPLFQDLAVGARQADEQVGKKGALDHFPHAFDPQVNGPPAVVDRHDVVLIVQQGGQVKHRRAGQTQQQHAFGGGEPPRPLDGHADVVEEDEHAHHDGQLVRQRLLEQLVARAVTEQVADDGGDAHDRPDDQLNIGQLDAVEFGTRFV